MRISDWSSDVCSSDLRGRSVDRAGILSAIEVLREAADHLAEVGEALFTYVLGVDRDYRRRRTAAADARARDRHLLQVLSFGFVRLRSRSEEHTSELQSLMRIPYAVICLKKNTINTYTN